MMRALGMLGIFLYMVGLAWPAAARVGHTTERQARLVTQPRAILPKSGEEQFELTFWESIKDSERAEDYEAYLEAYPDGHFAPLAKARAAYLGKPSDDTPETVSPAAPSPPAPDPAALSPATVSPVIEEIKTPGGNAQELEIEEMEAAFEATANADVREAPTTESPIVTQLEPASQVQVTGRVAYTDWYRVETGAGTGFVSGDFIKKAPPLATVVPVTRDPEPLPEAEQATVTIAPIPTPPPPSPAEPEIVEIVTRASVEEAVTEPSVVERVVNNLASGVIQHCAACPQMVALSPGTFVMGSNQGDKSERPAHPVSIDYKFAIGKHEVTEAQWESCVQAGACNAKPIENGVSGTTPVRNVSWNDAQRYVAWLSEFTAEPYRLPTEAEWEYAARGGTETRYWWGEEIGDGYANCMGCGGQWNSKAPADIGLYPANPFGLHDVNGGVWEWCSDCWHKSYAAAPSDGSAREKSDCRSRVLRGGSWRNDPSYVHSSSRLSYDTDVSYVLHGFRVALTVE